jgi:hypothetical protein
MRVKFVDLVERRFLFGVRYQFRVSEPGIGAADRW